MHKWLTLLCRPALYALLVHCRSLAAAAVSGLSMASTSGQPQSARRTADAGQQLPHQQPAAAAGSTAPVNASTAPAAGSAGTDAAAESAAVAAAAAATVQLAGPAALSNVSSTSSNAGAAAMLPGTTAPAAAAPPPAAADAPGAAPALAPIKTVSKRGRFVVTQVTPGSTACSTPKSVLFAPPAATSASSSCTAGAAATPTASPAGSAAAAAAAGGSSNRAALNAAAAAAAAAWLEAAAASSAAAAAGGTVGAGGRSADTLVLTCPVCDTPHALPGQQLPPGSTLAVATAVSLRQPCYGDQAAGEGGQQQQQPSQVLPLAVGGSAEVDTDEAAVAAAVPTGAVGGAAPAVTDSRSPLPPASPVATRDGSSTRGGTAAVVVPACRAGISPPAPVVGGGNGANSSNGSSPRVQHAVRAGHDALSPTNTPQRSCTASPVLHTCSSCGAPLPPLPLSGDLALQLSPLHPAVGAVAAAAHASQLAAALQLSAGSEVAAALEAAATAAAGSSLAEGDAVVGQAGLPQGLLAVAAARVLAARQQMQQELGSYCSDVSSQISFASCQQLQGGPVQAHQQQHQQPYSRSSSFATAVGGDSNGAPSGRSSISCLLSDGTAAGSATSSAGAAVTAQVQGAAAQNLPATPATAAAAGEVVSVVEHVLHRAPSAVLLAALQMPTLHPLQLLTTASDAGCSEGCSCSSPVCSMASSTDLHVAVRQQQVVLPALPVPAAAVSGVPVALAAGGSPMMLPVGSAGGLAPVAAWSPAAAAAPEPSGAGSLDAARGHRQGQ